MTLSGYLQADSKRSRKIDSDTARYPRGCGAVLAAFLIKARDLLRVREKDGMTAGQLDQATTAERAREACL
jgi:hypothetical protein